MPLAELSLDQIRAAAEQPRKSFYTESLEELAASIRERGVLEPIVVRPMQEAGETYYQIVMGERRFRASNLAGRTTIPAIIKEMDDDEAATDALLENFQREDLNAIDKACAAQRLIGLIGMEKTCRALGISAATARRLLELLELPEAIQQELIYRPDTSQGSAFNEGHARALQLLSEDPLTQTRLVAKVKREKLSVSHLEQIIDAIRKFPAKKQLFLHVTGGVSEQITRSLAAQEERKKPYRTQTAKEHLKTIDRRMNALGDVLDARIIDHLSLEELNALLSLTTLGARQISALSDLVHEAIELQDLAFSEVYTHCPLCGRVELVGGLRCSVCRTVLRRCFDCANYAEELRQCRARNGREISINEAEDPDDQAHSYQCRYYKPKIKPKNLNLSMIKN